MPPDVFEAAVDWIDAIAETDEQVDITFHGGEPLVVGLEWYQRSLPVLRERFGQQLKLHVQSNLWMLDEEYCALFADHRVSLGTSLDGPEHINDSQRGQGYFQRTMAAIERARAYGISVGCISTFTTRSAPHAAEIFDFFVHEGLNFSIHVALPSLRYVQPDVWTLSPEAHGELLESMLERYLDNLDKVRISTLDSLIRSVSAGHGGVCTFGDCLGGYLSVGPQGGIYLCQRFTGLSDLQFGDVRDCPSMEILSATPGWRMFQDRQERITEECSDCSYLDFCRGGCPYNALATNGGDFNGRLRDPHCVAYRRIFSVITDRAMEEVFSAENMEAVVEQADPKAGLLRRGRLLSIMRDGPHPSETTQQARRILAAVALAATDSPTEATRRLEKAGLVTNFVRSETALNALHECLTARVTGLNNIYLHVTFACNLHCAHCYAEASSPRKGSLPVDDVVHTCRQASKLGFRHVVITGGEPLLHPQRDLLLDALADLREEVKPLLTVLRTSLALPADANLLWRIGNSTDEVVVSVDGDEQTHDARRGAGSYKRTIDNLRMLAEMGYVTDLSLAAVLPLQQSNGAPGDAVRALAKELGIRRTRFRPLLPLGRAIDSELDIVPETLWGHTAPRNVVAYGFNPTASCGIGQNLYVEPDGGAYPCYAWHEEQWRLGYVNTGDGLHALIKSTAFQELGCHTVNTNRQCQNCALRYLCGGACRAWSGQQKQDDLDAPPLDCMPLFSRANSLLLSALRHLGITKERWLAADLPLPDSPPRVTTNSTRSPKEKDDER